MIGEIIKTSNCGCRISVILSTDKLVKEQPPKTFVVHKCDKLEVYQTKRGLNRFYKFNV
jgi:hypothetical protein